MTFEDASLMIEKGTIVYCVDGNNKIVEGRLIRFAIHSEVKSKDIRSDNPEIESVTNCDCTIALNDGSIINTNNICDKKEDIELSLKAAVEKQFAELNSILSKNNIAVIYKQDVSFVEEKLIQPLDER